MHDMHSEEFDRARRIAFTIAKAEASLGLSGAARLPFDDRLSAILHGAAENPAAVDAESYRLAFTLAQQDTANVANPQVKKQPGGPLHQPKQESQKQ